MATATLHQNSWFSFLHLIIDASFSYFLCATFYLASLFQEPLYKNRIGGNIYKEFGIVSFLRNYPLILGFIISSFCIRKISGFHWNSKLYPLESRPFWILQNLSQSEESIDQCYLRRITLEYLILKTARDVS